MSHKKNPWKLNLEKNLTKLVNLSSLQEVNLPKFCQFKTKEKRSNLISSHNCFYIVVKRAWFKNCENLATHLINPPCGDKKHLEKMKLNFKLSNYMIKFRHT